VTSLHPFVFNRYTNKDHRLRELYEGFAHRDTGDTARSRGAHGSHLIGCQPSCPWTTSPHAREASDEHKKPQCHAEEPGMRRLPRTMELLVPPWRRIRNTIHSQDPRERVSQPPPRHGSRSTLIDGIDATAATPLPRQTEAHAISLLLVEQLVHERKLRQLRAGRAKQVVARDASDALARVEILDLRCDSA